MKTTLLVATLISAAGFCFASLADAETRYSNVTYEKTPPQMPVDVSSLAQWIDELDTQSLRQPDNPKVWYQLGLAYAQADQTDRAVYSLQKAVTLAPGNELAWVNLGVNLGFEHRPKEAVNAFERALKLDENDPEIWNDYGMVLFELHRLPESEIALDRGFKLTSQSRRLWNSLGLLRNRQGPNARGGAGLSASSAHRPELRLRLE